MTGHDLKGLLKEWSEWLVQRSGTSDLPSDADGRVHEVANAGRSTWLIFGSWGKVAGSRREIHVPAGTNLFIVAGSSHATPGELPGNPSDQDLKKHAKKIDELWLHATLAQVAPDGVLTRLPLQTVETDVFEVTVDVNNTYKHMTGVQGKTKMVTVGRVHVLSPPSGTTHITMAAQSPESKGTGKKGEERYNVQVEYDVIVP